MSVTSTAQVPLMIRRRGGRTIVLPPDGSVIPGTSRQATTPSDMAVVKALAPVVWWRKLLEAGRYTTIDELARAEKINASYVSRVLRLTVLAPDIVEAILDGRQPMEMTLRGLMAGVDVNWRIDQK